MAMQTVKLRLMAETKPAKIMMVATVKVAVEPLAVAVNPVQTVSLILHHTDLNAVIQPGMNMALTVLI